MPAWKHLCVSLLAVLVIAGAGPAWGQYTTQTLTLKPGWNAVFLNVQPVQNGCEEVFADVPVSSVWSWVRRFEPTQFVRDPTELVPRMPDWLVYYPKDHPQAFLSDLHAIHGGRAYLIDFAGDAPLTLTLEGKAVVRDVKWVPNSFNLVGFHLAADAAPTFKRFFEGDPALADGQVFKTSPAGRSVAVIDPAGEALRQGEAYWVYCTGESTFNGPLTVDVDARDGIEFGEQLNEHLVRFANHARQEKTVTISVVPTERPTALASKAVLPDLGGGVALSYKRLLAWQPFEEPITFTMAPGSERGLQLAVRRADMALPATPDALYESLLRVEDSDGGLYYVPVTAARTSTPGGLWVGTVTIDAVSEASNPEDSVTPQATGTEFRFRLILHVDDTGQNAHLLSEVTLLQVQPVLEDDPDNPGQSIETEPGRYVLITDDSLIPEYSGASVRGDDIVGRRISSPNFAFDLPLPQLPMAGSIQSALEGVATMGYDSPLNPFVHRFHPDHNNLDERYDTMLDEGKESFSFTRDIRLEFSEEDPEELGVPAWGYDLIGGTYRETMLGVHQNDIHVQGRFRLNKVVDVSVLNDGR